MCALYCNWLAARARDSGASCSKPLATLVAEAGRPVFHLCLDRGLQTNLCHILQARGDHTNFEKKKEKRKTINRRKAPNPNFTNFWANFPTFRLFVFKFLEAKPMLFLFFVSISGGPKWALYQANRIARLRFLASHQFLESLRELLGELLKGCECNSKSCSENAMYCEHERGTLLILVAHTRRVTPIALHSVSRTVS